MRITDRRGALYNRFLKAYLVWFAIVLASISCAQQNARVEEIEVEEGSGGEEFGLGAGDVFDVRVYGEKELSGQYQVGPDGSIDFPFVGSVAVAGKSGPQVASCISQALREGDYLKDPQVSVFVQAMNSKRISIVGAVAKPGSLVFVPGLTVVQAISLTGGFSALADRDGTVVTRRTESGLRRFTVRAGAVTRGDADDFALRPGDIVFVPERIF